jgi:flavin reductase (DIM6/NTAB) family NADH-FMN oxidoreductase RutF
MTAAFGGVPTHRQQTLREAAAADCRNHVLFDFDTLDAQQKYKLLTATVVPRPIAWVVTQNLKGAINCAPFSFFNAFSGDPPTVCLGIGAREGVAKDTAVNIHQTGEFVVNLVHEALVKQMNITAIEFGPEIDELAQAGLSTIPSVKVRPPRIAASPVALECKRLVTLEIGVSRAIVVGNVVAMHVADEAVRDASKCYIDTPKLGLLGRMHGGGWYARTNDQFELPRLSENEWWSGKR